MDWHKRFGGQRRRRLSPDPAGTDWTGMRDTGVVGKDGKDGVSPYGRGPYIYYRAYRIP